MFCHIFMKFGIEFFKQLPSRREFRENRLIDTRAVLKVLNEFLSILVTLFDRLGQI